MAPTPRQNAAVILALCVTCVVVSFLFFNGAHVVLPFGAVLVALWRLVRASDDPPRFTTEEIDQLADRAGPSRGKQIVGETCAVCARAVMVAAEGAFCKKCNAPVHRACREAHDEAAHAVIPPGYR